LKDDCHSLDRRHFVLVGVLDFIWRDCKHHSGYDVSGAAGERGHGVVCLAADRNDGFVFDLQRDHVEPSQRIASPGQSPAERRHLYGLELECAV